MRQMHVNRSHLHVFELKRVNNGAFVGENACKSELQFGRPDLSFESVQPILADVNDGAQCIEALVADILESQFQKELVELISPLFFGIKEEGLWNCLAAFLASEDQ